MKISSVVYNSNVIFAVSIIILCLALFSDPFSLFSYQRENILHGEYWRLLSGHLTHTSGMHLLINLAAWLLVWLYGFPVMGALTWTIAFILCTVLSSAGFLILLPELHYYEGISGILHGLLVIIALVRMQISFFDPTAWIALFFIVAKIIYEGIYGASAMTQSIIDLPILTESHLYGVVAGLLVAISIWTFRYILSVYRRSTEIRSDVFSVFR